MKKLLVVLAILAGIILSGCIGANDMAIHITTLEQLQAMKNDLTADYILDNDIDTSATSGWNGGLGFEPIAIVGWFTGSLDGQNFTISNLYINRPTQRYIGLFSNVDGAQISNVNFTGVNITGKREVGASIGFAKGSAAISNCSSGGAVEATGTGSDGRYVGGLIGIAFADTITITGCQTTGTVTGRGWTGGLVGYNKAIISESHSLATVINNDEYSAGGLVGWTNGNISKCYAKGNVSSNCGDVGGLAGVSAGSAVISNCYAQGVVSGDDFVGGLVGDMQGTSSVSKCYSTGLVTGNTFVGGLVGNDSATVTNSFWDTETSNQSSSDRGTGKTTNEMNTKSTFTDAGWDFDTIWNICSSRIPPYPWLQWEGISCTDKEAPWDEDILEPTGEVKVEIPPVSPPATEGEPARRSGNWATLPDVMRIHTSNGEDTSSLRAPIEIGQAELLCCNISKNFNSFEEASDWYKNLEGYATQISLGCNIGGSPVSKRLFTGIIKTVHPHRLSQTAEIKVIDFLDYFGRVTIDETPVWENISLTQLFKNLVELAFTDWTHGVDYFVEDLGGSTIPAIGYTDLNLLNELKMIAASRGKRIYTDAYGRPHCASRNPERDPITVSHDYNLEKNVKERRDINSILNWIVVHATPYEIKPDLEAPGKISGFTATPGDQKIDLTWNNPTDDDFEKVLIHFMTTRYPLNKEEGTKIYEGTGESKEHTGLTNGQKYFYSAWTVDDKGNWSDAAHAAAIAGIGEDAGEDDTGFYGGPGISKVTEFTAMPEHSKIILTWLNPNVPDFDKVVIRRSSSSYPSSPTSGSAEYDGTAETHSDTGLTNGKRYYYSAFAKNTAGDYSSAAFASAIPAGARQVITSQKIFGGGCLEARWSGPIYTEQEVYGCPACNVLGTNYSRNVELRFDGISGYSENWLRFRHEWDIWVHSAYAYKSNERHETGRKDDLDVGFSHDIGGIVNVTVTKIVVRSNQVKINYKLTYTGGKAMCIGYRNKLSLMG